MRVTARQRFRAWLLLATFVASLGSTGLSFDHLGIVDTACGEVSLSTGAVDTAFSNPDSGPQHCPVCHFLRAVSGASATAPARLVAQQGVSIEFVPASDTLLTVDLVAIPSRGPPARTLTFSA